MVFFQADSSTCSATVGSSTLTTGAFAKSSTGAGFGAELLQRGLLFGQRLHRFFIGVVGGQPDLMAQRDGVIVERKNIGFAHADAVVAVLLVVADAHDHANARDSGRADSRAARRRPLPLNSRRRR